MNPNYPISDRLKAAIEKVFDNPEYGFEPVHGFEALGYNDETLKILGLSKRSAVPSDISLEKRVGLLKRELENFVELNADQVDEFEGYDLRRLSDETRATLLALRDIHHFFPDVPIASHEEFKAYRKRV